VRRFVLSQGRGLVLLVLVKVKRRLDLVSQALPFGRLGVRMTAVLLLVYVAGTSALFLY
jgi:hypothetical protein